MECPEARHLKVVALFDTYLHLHIPTLMRQTRDSRAVFCSASFSVFLLSFISLSLSRHSCRLAFHILCADTLSYTRTSNVSSRICINESLNCLDDVVLCVVCCVLYSILCQRTRNATSVFHMGAGLHAVRVFEQVEH